MSHALERTSPKGEGQTFIGYCVKCGEQGLTPKAILEDCPADDVMSDEDALLSLID